ncbi:MAG: hypothetical protein LJE95_12380 [Acidobacteria bacterium]|nr:hypothetical protein [Acidobacteriota bacterium]
MAEIIADQRLISVSVGELVEEPGRRAIGLGGTGLSRLWIGQELHRRVQAARLAAEPGYRSEVVVGGTLGIDGWEVDISGRADGIVENDGTVTRVDEIKTLHFAVDLNNLYHQERLDQFRRQVSLYASLLSPPEEPAAAQLLLVDIATGEERLETVAWSHRTVESWVRQRIRHLLAEERRRLAHVEAAREAARGLAFPHPEVRPVQETIMEAVRDSLGSDRHLLLSAPTGCGKTAAVLFPALRTALEHGQRVIYLTAKTLQQRIAVSTVRAMSGGRIRSLQLRAKSKMCAHAEMICHEEFCPYAEEYGLKLVRSALIPQLLRERSHLDPDEVYDRSVAASVCPFEVSLDLLDETDLVICDYNYVFDPAIGLDAVLRRGALSGAVLVIDEAHNLVDRSREYYSPQIGTHETSAALAFVTARHGPVFASLESLIRDIEDLIQVVVGSSSMEGPAQEALVELPTEEIGELRMRFDAAMLAYWMYKRENEMWLADDPVQQLFLTLTRFHRVLADDGEELVHLVSKGENDNVTLRILCRDASRFLGRILDSSAGAVALSATLEPFEFYSDMLGFDRDRTDMLRVPSPFPAENRLVTVINTVDTTYRRRAASYDAIAAWIARLAPPRRNVLALFPSYAFLERVADRLPPTPHRVLRQVRGATDSDQHRILAALGNGEPHLVLAVLGGIFAEGVDYPGEMLSEVVVVSPGLPQFNTDRELLRDYYREHYEHGFEYAYLIPGMTRVVQAAGRLIRSADDRGVIVLIGRRFLQPQYARLLPQEWLSDDPCDLLHEDPGEAVRRFFEGS